MSLESLLFLLAVFLLEVFGQLVHHGLCDGVAARANGFALAAKDYIAEQFSIGGGKGGSGDAVGFFAESGFDAPASFYSFDFSSSLRASLTSLGNRFSTQLLTDLPTPAPSSPEPRRTADLTIPQQIASPISSPDFASSS